MVSIHVTIDQGRAAEQLRKRTARALEKRGQMLANQAVKETQKLINSELGPSTNRGLTSMRSMPLRGTCDSGGDFPIVVTLHNDVSGPSAAKFGALEYGARGGLYITETPFAFNGRQDGKRVVTRITKREASAGHQFMKRGLGIAAAGVYAGFQFTRTNPSAFASTSRFRRR